ncbi:MAG: hypothetical protein VST68_10475 [Nitrospirota bacterium]|nr:hypothetical protein [Nitrospirota bacterium]
MNISHTWPINALGEIDISSRGEWSKKHALAKAVGPLCPPPKPEGAKTPFSTGKAAAIWTRGAYSQYVSANAAKSGKSVSPKVRHNGENAAGGFFQHSLPPS